MTNHRHESDVGSDPFSQSTNKTSSSPMGSWAGSVPVTPSSDRGGGNSSLHPPQGGVGVAQEAGSNVEELVARWKKLCGPDYQVEVSELLFSSF